VSDKKPGSRPAIIVLPAADAKILHNALYIFLSGRDLALSAIAKEVREQIERDVKDSAYKFGGEL